jgi:hypothetical protein
MAIDDIKAAKKRTNNEKARARRKRARQAWLAKQTTKEANI